MAEAMIGFGIGLSGTPKDYTSLIAAQERQRAADEAKARADKVKKYEDVMKGLNIEEHLGYKKEELGVLLGETLEKVKKATDTDSYRDRITALNEFADAVRRSKAEWKDVQDYKKDLAEGKINSDIDIQALEKARTLDEIKKFVPYDENTKTIQLAKVPKIDFGKIYGEVARFAEKKPTGNYYNYETADGRTIRQAEMAADPDEIAFNLDVQWKQNPLVAPNAIIDYKRLIGASGKTAAEIGKTDEQLTDEAYKFYMKNGLDYGLSQKIFTLPQKPSETKFSVAVGGAKEGTFGDWTQQPLRFKFITMKGEESTGGYDDSWGMTFGKTEVSMPNTTGYKDLNTGKDIGFTIGDNIKAQGVYVLPVYKKDSQITVGKNAKKAGEIVLPYNLDKEARAGNVEYKLIATGQGTIMPGGTDEKGRPIEENVKVYRPFNEVMGAFSDGLTPAEKKDWKNKYQEGLRLVNEENEKLKQLYGGGAAPAKSTGKTTTAPTGKKVYTQTEWKSMTPSQRQAALKRGESFK